MKNEEKTSVTSTGSSNNSQSTLKNSESNKDLTSSEKSQAGHTLKEKKPVDNSDEKPKKQRMNKGEIEGCLFDFLEGEPNEAFKYMAPFSKNFLVYRKEPGDKPMLLKINRKDNTVKVSDIDVLAADLRLRVRAFTEFNKDLNVDFKTCLNAATAWIAMTKKYTLNGDDWPKSVGFKSEKELCFFRHDFDPVRPDNFAEKCPTLANWLNLVETNRHAIFIRGGSLYAKNADRKQAIWMYGPGGGGKSFFDDLIGLMAGGPHAAFDISPSLMGTPHWKEPLVGKTVMIAREASSFFSNRRLVDEFKSLTGDSWHSINPKGKKIAQVKLNCFVFFSSNEEPEIPRKREIIDRLLLCHVRPIPDDQKLPPDLLMSKVKEELPFFIGECIARYEEHGNGRIIPDSASQVAAEMAIESYENEITSIFDKYFEFSDKAISAKTSVLNCDFFDLFRQNYKYGVNDKAVREFLKSRKCDYQALGYVDGKKVRYVSGVIRKKSPFPNLLR